jgi:hypothetical protein
MSRTRISLLEEQIEEGQIDDASDSDLETNEFKKEQIEAGQIEQISESDRALIEAFKTEAQDPKRILLGDYHPRAFKPTLSEKLQRDSFSLGDSGLFKRNSAGKLVLDTKTNTLENSGTILRNSK